MSPAMMVIIVGSIVAHSGAMRPDAAEHDKSKVEDKQFSDEAASPGWNESLLAYTASGKNSGGRKQISSQDYQDLMVFVNGKVFAALTKFLAMDFCWRDFYQDTCKMAECADGWESDYFGMCREKCRPKYRRYGWKPWKCRTKRQDPGYTTPSVSRKNDAATACPSNRPAKRKGPSAYWCCPQARNGYSCTYLGYCNENCPLGLQKCGVGACTAMGLTCGAKIGQMVTSTLAALAQSALLIVSAGLAGGGPNQLFSKASMKAFQKAAKGNLKGFQKRLAENASKKGLKAMAKKMLDKEKVEQVLTDNAYDLAVASLDKAVDAYIDEILVRKEEDLDEFDYTRLDPTGVASAVKKKVTGENSLTQAKAWADVVSTVDPTGWVAAAASFMNPKCSNMQ